MLCYVMLVCMDKTLVMYGHSVLCNIGHSDDETCMSVCMMKSESDGHSVFLFMCFYSLYNYCQKCYVLSKILCCVMCCLEIECYRTELLSEFCCTPAVAASTISVIASLQIKECGRI
jgi:hypothetical protein